MENQFYNEFLNKNNNFKKEIVYFTDLESAINYGKLNFENFSIDIINSIN